MAFLLSPPFGLPLLNTLTGNIDIFNTFLLGNNSYGTEIFFTEKNY